MPAPRKLPSGKWQARFRDPRDGKVKAVPGLETFTHKTRAMAAGAQAERDAVHGPRAADATLTWGQWCERWWPTRLVEPSTLTRDASRRDKHLLPRWRDVPLSAINRQDVREWAAGLGRTDNQRAGGQALAAGTVQRIVHVFSASLNAAVDAELLNANPAAKLRLSPSRPGAEHFITPVEFDLIAAELDEWELRMAAFLFGTGLRWGEAAGLHWGRVDLERRTVHVMDTLRITDRVIKPYPKSRRAREVPIPDFILDMLPDVPPAVGDCGLQHESGRCHGPLVLTTSKGNPWDLSNFRRQFYRAVELAGVEHTRVHDLRHSYASWLLNAGMELERIGGLLGHTSPITTLRYAHLSKGRHDDVLAILNGGGQGARRATNVPQRGTQGLIRAHTAVN